MEERGEQTGWRMAECILGKMEPLWGKRRENERNNNKAKHCDFCDYVYLEDNTSLEKKNLPSKLSAALFYQIFDQNNLFH